MRDLCRINRGYKNKPPSLSVKKNDTAFVTIICCEVLDVHIIETIRCDTSRLPSILRRLLYGIDNKDIDRSFRGFQPQSKLLLNCREQ